MKSHGVNLPDFGLCSKIDVHVFRYVQENLWVDAKGPPDLVYPGAFLWWQGLGDLAASAPMVDLSL